MSSLTLMGSEAQPVVEGFLKRETIFRNRFEKGFVREGPVAFAMERYYDKKHHFFRDYNFILIVDVSLIVLLDR